MILSLPSTLHSGSPQILSIFSNRATDLTFYQYIHKIPIFPYNTAPKSPAFLPTYTHIPLLFSRCFCHYSVIILSLALFPQLIFSHAKAHAKLTAPSSSILTFRLTFSYNLFLTIGVQSSAYIQHLNLNFNLNTA